MSGRQKLERATQPNTHPISERDETDIWYTPAAFQCHFPNEKKKRKEWDISAFL